MYENDGSSLAWLQNCYEVIRDNYKEYLLLQKLTLEYIIDQYVGPNEDHISLNEGSFIHISEGNYVIDLDYFYGDNKQKLPLSVHLLDGDYKLIKVSETKNSITIQNGEEELPFNWSVFKDFLNDKDYFDYVIRNMSDGHLAFYKDIYSDVKCFIDDDIPALVNNLKIDFHGFGFPQFNDLKLNKSVFGSECVDEYISKAFPTFSSDEITIDDTHPIFWKGDIPEKVRNSECYYIVRIISCFKIKKGKKAFVHFKGYDPKYNKSLHTKEGRDNQLENNAIFNNGIVLETTYIYDAETQKYWSMYIDNKGNVKDAEVEITLDRNDYELFLETYDIDTLTVIDGCYFDKN